MAVENYDFVPLRVDTIIKPFKSKDDDLNGFLFDDAQKYFRESVGTLSVWSNSCSRMEIVQDAVL